MNAIETIPHSEEAEQAVLGSILINQGIFRELGPLEPTDFYLDRNRWIYLTVMEMHTTGQTIDYLTVIDALEKKGKLAEVGGPARLTSLITATVSSYNAPAYAAIIREKSMRRKVIETATRLARSAYDDTQVVDVAVSNGITSLSHVAVTSGGAVHISNFLSQIYDETDAALKNPAEIYGISTGLPDWDKITGGLQKGEVVRLSGEPGLGKSLLLFQILTNIAATGVPVALYELEMGGRQVVRRGVSSKSKIGTAAMRSGKITPDEFPVFIQAIESMEKLPIYISESSSLTTQTMRADIERLIDQYHVQVIGIDYEALLNDTGPNENERRSRISDHVHNMVKDLNIACISIGDMTKSGIRGETRGQGSMAGTARELHNADSIVIMRKEDENTNVITLTWEKLREGDGERFMRLVKLPGLPAFGPAVLQPSQNQRTWNDDLDL